MCWKAMTANSLIPTTHTQLSIEIRTIGAMNQTTPKQHLKMKMKETATQELSTLLTELFDNYRDNVISHKTYEKLKQEVLLDCMKKERQQMLEFTFSLFSNVDDALENYIKGEFDKHYDVTYLVD